MIYHLLRWHFFLAIVGAHPPFLTSLRTQLVGFSLTMTPGKVGELYKCYLIEQRTGVPSARTRSSVRSWPTWTPLAGAARR